MASQEVRDIPESESAVLFPPFPKKEENKQESSQKVEQAQPVQQQGQSQVQLQQQQQFLQVMQAMQAMQANQANQQRFYQIIDVVTEYLRGNFLPAIHALRYNMIPKNYIDHTGFNYLHIAVSQNQIPIVLLLLDTLRLDVNIRSVIQQTPLMVACNYGHIELVKILCDRGAQINPKDNTGFSALTYAAKNGFIPIVAYLLHQEADVAVVDMNGCTLVHWAAYRNNVFLLKMLRSLGQNLNAVDLAGLEPLERAVSSSSIEAVKFLVQYAGDKKPQKLDLKTVTDPDMLKILKKKFEPTPSQIRKEKYINGFTRKSRWGTFGVYLLIWLMTISLQLVVVMSNREGSALMRNIIWVLISLYSLFYSFWYFTKSYKFTKKYKPVGQLDDSVELSNIQPERRFQSGALDKLLKGKDEAMVVQEVSESGAPLSFLHELASYFDSKNYKEIQRFNEKDFCASCIIRRPERSEHHEKSGLCVQHFHHYSPTLGKPINKENHFLYFLLLLQQQILLSMLIFGVRSEYNYHHHDGYRHLIMWVFESAWDLFDRYSLMQASYFMIVFVLLCYNSFFFFLEIYLMVKNLTYNEFFNRNSKRYLFSIKKDARGAYVHAFKNPYDLGALQNIKQYVMRAWHSNNF